LQNMDESEVRKVKREISLLTNRSKVAA
jgi:hypothetical protein